MSAPNAATASTRTTMTHDICPDCDGEGSHTHIGPPGWYDPRQQSWYPTETNIPCETCGGSGRIEIHAQEPTTDTPQDTVIPGAAMELPF